MKSLFMFLTKNKIACKYCLVLISALCSISIFAQGSFTITKNGQFYHIGGSIAGAYDLIADTEKWVVDSDNDKDMRNTDPAGAPFTGSWETGTGNNTMYVQDNAYDYINASPASADSAYNIGTPSSSVSNPVAGDIYIAKLRGGSDFCVIKIISMDPADNTCVCLNTGKISFEYKKDTCSSQTSPISGPTNVNVNAIENYAVAFHAGSIYNWSVTGGNQVSGGQTNFISIQWGTMGIGQVTVVETDSTGCIGDTVFLIVNIGIGGAPEITSVNPGTAYQNQSLYVHIYGQFTNFVQGSPTTTWFSKDTSTIFPSWNDVWSDTHVDGYFSIPSNAPTGYWDVHVYDSLDGQLTKDSGLYIAAPPPPSISFVSPNSAYQNQSLYVHIYGQFTNFVQGSPTTTWFSKDTSTIFPIWNDVWSDTHVDGYFSIPSNAPTGYWDVNVYDNIDSLITKDNGFYIKAPPSIISVSPDSAYLGDALSVTISGQNTNFTQGSVSVWFNQGSTTINSSSFNVSNDTLLDAFFNIPINAQTGYWDVNVYDDFDWIVTLLDGFKILCKPVTGAIIGSINVSENTTENYSVPFHLGSLYYWSVLGGNQVSGNLTSSISIQWGTTAIGLITVVETDSMGCIGDTVSLSVNIGFIGLNENEPGLHTVHVYPNPLRNKLTITFPYKNALYFVNIYDIQGKEVVRKIFPILRDAINGVSYDLDLSQQKSGVYFVKISDKKGITFIKKIVLE